MRSIATLLLFVSYCSNNVFGWAPQRLPSLIVRPDGLKQSARLSTAIGVEKHGENACFLPLKQFDEEYYSARIFQVAGVYPGLSVEDYFAVTSEGPPEKGQWAYDFSDPDGPQMGTVAIEGNQITGEVVDGVVLICDHFTMGVPLPETIKDPVDLAVLVDRACDYYEDRQFMVLDTPEGIKVEAYSTFAEMPNGYKVIGHVKYVLVPWLPSMVRTSSGFMEEDY